MNKIMEMIVQKNIAPIYTGKEYKIGDVVSLSTADELNAQFGANTVVILENFDKVPGPGAPQYTFITPPADTQLSLL